MMCWVPRAGTRKPTALGRPCQVQSAMTRAPVFAALTSAEQGNLCMRADVSHTHFYACSDPMAMDKEPGNRDHGYDGDLPNYAPKVVADAISRQLKEERQAILPEAIPLSKGLCGTSRTCVLQCVLRNVRCQVPRWLSYRKRTGSCGT